MGVDWDGLNGNFRSRISEKCVLHGKRENGSALGHRRSVLVICKSRSIK